MKIIILDMLINQYENREVATTSLRRIDKELRNLSAIVDNGRQAVLEYFIKGNDGKPFHGLKNNVPVYKYDLTDGDRILYVHGTSLSYLNEEDRDSYVLVSYAPHDLQEKIARKGHFFHKHSYTDIKDYVQTVDETDILTETECNNIASLFFGDFKAYVIDDSELENLSANDLDKRVLLTKEQYAYLSEWKENSIPMLITGGAGTGKTVMSIRMLESFNNNQNDSSAVYFTQSKELRKNGKKQLCSLLNIDNKDSEDPCVETDNNNIIDFFNINDYCMQKLNVHNSSYVLFNDFEKVFCKNNTEVERLRKKSKLSYFDIWTDIRGVIKGSLNEYWQRRKSVSQTEFSKVEQLVKKGYLVRSQKDPQQLQLSCNTRDARKKLHSSTLLTNDEKLIYKNIIDKFETVDTSMPLISFEEYMSVSEEISLAPCEQRSYVYKICELYQQWLKNEKKYDENDLALQVLSLDALDKYDFIVVDEVQDYTELQLLLIYNLCDNKNAFVYAGDIHQVINPTVFNHEKLKKLFLNETGTESNLIIRSLSSNYRCQQGIVDAANNISKFRRSTIGKKDTKFEQEEISHDPTVISNPMRITYSENNLKDLLFEIMKYPRIGILVANDEDRNNLISAIGHEAYSEHPCIFTASEIKGVEYQYVVCIDMFSSYYAKWQEILADDTIKKRETKYRFYFNLLYVALTRAQLHICFMDKSPVDEIDKLLNLDFHNCFDADSCRFTDLGNSLWDWYAQAREYHNNGIYDKAIMYYKKSGECASKNEIIECQIGNAELQRDYVSCIKYALLNGNISLAQKYKNHESVSDELKTLIDWFAETTTEVGITKLIEHNFNDFSEEDLMMLYSVVKKKLQVEAQELSALSIIPKGV